jgi:hypothetical protein
LCTTCATGTETTACTGVVSGLNTYYSAGAVIQADSVSSYVASVTAAGVLTCSSAAFAKTPATDLWCLNCADASFGVMGAATCEATATSTAGKLMAKTCIAGYIATAITGSTYFTCNYCGVGATTCTFTAGAVSAITCGAGYVTPTTSNKLTCAKIPAAYASTATTVDGVTFAAATVADCNSGYYFSTPTCTVCPAAYATCTTATSGTCASGYYLTAATTCAIIPAAVVGCSVATTVASFGTPVACTTCANGYV